MDNNSNQPTTSNTGNNRIFNILAYIGLLWIVGLVAAPNEPSVRFHVNQGLVLFLFEVALSIIMIIPILGWLVGLVGGIAAFVFAIIGIINAVNDQQKELPLIGKIHLLK